MTCSLDDSWILRHASARRFYRDRPVLVLGGDGFLGQNCVRALLGLGARVSSVSRRASLPRKPNLRELTGDLRDLHTVERAVDGQSVVFDFVGVYGPVDSNRHPRNSLLEECLPQLNVAETCARLAQRPRIVFCSSRLVYGKPRHLPVDEAHPLSPQSIYAVSKVAAESLLECYRNRFDVPYTVFRLSNPYGPHRFSHVRSYGVINHLIRRAVRGEPIELFGGGRQRRDYIFVEDVVGAFLLAAARAECANEIFNLGGEHSLSMAEAAHTIVRLTGDVEVRSVPWPRDYEEVETGDYATDLRKVQRLVQPPAQISFDDGVARTIAYYRGELDTAKASDAGGRVRQRGSRGGRSRGR
ncbi:MAG: NAD-dependent epimerase/dehydratase family protein [Alphaproteobacteria bacterium]